MSVREVEISYPNKREPKKDRRKSKRNNSTEIMSSNSRNDNKHTTTISTSSTNTPNELMLQSTIQLQDDTKRVLESIQSSLVECDMIGCTTLVTLDEDNYKTSKILRDATRLNTNLGTTCKLQNKYALWSFNWNNTTGRAKRQMRKKEKENMKQRKKQEQEEQLKLWELETKKIKATNNPKTIIDASNRNDKELLFRGCHQSSQKGPGGGHHIHWSPDKNINNGAMKVQQSSSRQDQLTHPEQSMLDHVEYTNDVDIDSTLDSISKQMESLLIVSNTIHDSITIQNSKLSTLENELDKVDEKQSIINSRHLRFMNKNNKKRKK